MKHGTRLGLAVLALIMLVGMTSASASPVPATIAGYSMTSDWNGTDMFSYIRDNLGVDLDGTVVPLDAWPNQLSLMLLNDNLPDIIYNNTTGDYNTINSYGDQGYFLDFTKYLDIMPNFARILEEYPEYKNYITSPSGAIYAMARINPKDTINDNSKAQINTRWLKNVGKEVPTSLDELYDVLVAFRDQDANGNGDPNDEIPMAYCNASAGSYRIEWNIRAAFGIVSDQKSYCLQADPDGKLYIAETTEGYKNFLKYMNKLYKEGLLDSETYIMTNDEFRAKLREDIIGMGNDSSTISLRSNLGEENFDYCFAYTSEFAQEPQYVVGAYWLTNPRLCVSASTEHPEEICKMIDWFLTTEGSELAYMGQEGVNFDRVKNQLGIDEYDYSAYYKAAGYEDQTSYLNQKGVVQDVFYLLNFEPAKAYLNGLSDDELASFIEQDTANVYRGTSTFIRALRKAKLVNAFPVLNYTQEQIEARKDIYNDITSYLNTMKVQFITGVVDIDEYWDTFISTLSSQGLDRILAIDQEAYDQIK